MRNRSLVATLTEDNIRTNLIDCQGDVVQCAYFMHVTPRELDAAIKSSPALQAVVLGIEKVKINPEYEKLSAEQFRAEFDAMTRGYRLEGLQVIHDIAMQDHGDSAAMADVRLKAAIQLRGLDTAHQSDGTTGVLHELNTLYQQHAPRLKSMRATLTIELQGTPAASEPIPLLPELPPDQIDAASPRSRDAEDRS